MFKLFSTAFFAIGIFSSLTAQSTVTILCYKSGYEKGKLTSLSKSLSADNKKKIKEINIINYLSNKTLQPQNDDITEGKCEITYKELVSNCATDLCNVAEEDIVRYMNGSLNKLIICGKMSCSNFSIETSFIPDDNIGMLSKKVSDEIKLNKKEKLNIIILIPGDPTQIPSVKFSSESVQLGQQKKVTLNPIASGIKLSYKWSPTEGLSCSTCPNPEASPARTTTYSVRVTDINGCESNPAEIEVQVKNLNTATNNNEENCDECVDLHLITKKELKFLEESVGIENVYLGFKKASGCNNQDRLALLRNTQSESMFVYDIPFKGNINSCATSYSVKIYREDKPTIFYESKSPVSIETIGENSGNKYVNQGFYTFRLNLSKQVASGEFPIDIKGFCERKDLNDPNKDYIYKMEITFYNVNQLECGTIRTGALAISDCSVGAAH